MQRLIEILFMIIVAVIIGICVVQVSKLISIAIVGGELDFFFNELYRLLWRPSLL